MSQDQSCPGCGTKLTAGAVLCIECGLDLETGEKIQTVRKPLRRRWYFGPGAHWSCPVALLAAGGLGLTPLFLPGKRPRPPVPPTVVALYVVVYVCISILCLGTYHRVSLTRNRKGKLLVTRKRWLCFVPMDAVTVDLSHYKAVRILSPFDTNSLENRFALQLRSETGHPSVTIYRGTQEKRLADVAATIAELAGLDIER